MAVSALKSDGTLQLETISVTSEHHAQMLALAEHMAGLGHWLLDLRNDSLFWSDEIYRIHGVTPEDYTPEIDTAIAFYHPDDIGEVTAALETAIAEKKEFEFECRIVRPGGEVRIVHSKSLVQTDEDGEASAIFGIFQDVTEQRATDARLKAINERYQVAIQASEAGIWDIDMSSNQFYFSPAIHELIGSDDTNRRIPLDDFWEMLHPADRERAQNDVRAHVEDGEKYESEYRIRRPDCRYVWLHSTGKVILDEHGKPSRMAGSVFEIGDRKRDEEMREEVYRLLTSEKLEPGESIRHLLSIGLRYLDLDIGIVSRISGDDYVVRFVEDKLGNVESGMRFVLGDTYCVHTLNNRGVRSYWHAGESDIADHPCYKGFGLESYIGVAIVVDNELYGTLNFSSPDKRARPFGAREESFVAMLSQWIAYEIRQQRDITRAEEARQALERQAELLQKTNRDLDDFAYIASHDLKAPMRGIQSLASWIEEDLGDEASEETRDNLALLKNRVERMDRMLADILAYSRAGKDTAEAEPVDCRELVEEVFDWIECGDAFSLKIDGDLPRVEVPRTSLQQVFLNLVSNAVKHHDRNEGSVTVTCERGDDEFVFHVEDDGPGIPARYEEKIFRMFETLQRRDDVESSGIGLAIVDRLVQSLGGTIRLVPNGKKRGSRFRFTLPLDVELAGAADA